MLEAIQVKHVMDHYEIYVHGKFECSCDPGELTSEINRVEKKLFELEQR